MAKKLGELNNKGEMNVSASCEISENSRKSTVAGEPITVTTQVACAEQAPAQQGQATAQAPAQQAQGQAAAQGQAQAPAAQQAKPAPVKMCTKTELQPTTKEIVLVSHEATIKYSFTPARMLMTPVAPKAPAQQQAPAQQAQAPAQQAQGQANPPAQAIGQNGQSSQNGQN